MIYKSLTFSFLCSIIIAFTPLSAQYIPCEKEYTVYFSPLLQKIKSLPGFEGKIKLGSSSAVLPLSGTSFAPNGQELIQNKGKIYLFLLQTGFIFQMSEPTGDSVVFIKMDNTININYNIDCNNFIYKDQIYNYGGYGFWTLFGHLRKFNQVDKEWDIEPTSQEVISAGYDWFSPSEGRIYVPVQKIENAGIKKQEGKQNYYAFESFYLDLQTKDWVKMGKISQEIIQLVNQKTSYISYLHDNGKIFILNDVAYLFDFKNNKVFKSKRSDVNQFFIRSAHDLTVFFYNGKFYKYEPNKQTFKILEINLGDFQLLDYPIWHRDYTSLIIVIGICLAIGIIILLYLAFKRRIKKKIQNDHFRSLKTKIVNHAFTEIEMSLIRLLLNAFDSNRNLEIAEINHVLGIKDKNIGLQKKVRSDIINAINDKYLFITQGEVNLIGSIRKEDDKRFFEYFISPSEIKIAQKLIEGN